MCLALIAYRVFPEWPLFVAANRDEERARPSLPPARRQVDGVDVLAPRDLRAGGTWLGVNARGLLALVTNRSDLLRSPPPGARSRGLLVERVLGAETWAAAIARWEADRTIPSSPYNLFLADSANAALLAWAGEGEPSRTDLAPGVHVVSNHGFGNDRRVGEVARALRYWERAMAARTDPWEAARGLLSLAEADRGLPPILKRGAIRGTVSATICGLGASSNCRMLHADGPPDAAEWVESSI
ncbi:MAG: NRDE family protein [Planctomycetes bacterium]|nr:NRDE family protein [Planctomycetota bacterium]